MSKSQHPRFSLLSETRSLTTAGIMAVALFAITPLFVLIETGPRIYENTPPEPPHDRPPDPPMVTPPTKDQEPEDPPPELRETPPPPPDLELISQSLNPVSSGIFFGPGVLAAIELLSEEDLLVDLKDLDEPPRAITQVTPRVNSRQTRDGTIVVRFIIERDGRVREVFIERSFDQYHARAVLEAVRKWQFEPGRKGGEIVRCRVRQVFSFEKVD